MRPLLAALAAATCLALGLQGCGQTGPLYMPDETPPADTQDATGESGDGGGAEAGEADVAEEPDAESSGPEPVN